MSTFHFHTADGNHHEVEADNEEAATEQIVLEYNRRNTAPNGYFVSPHPIVRVDTSFAEEEKENEELVDKGEDSTTIAKHSAADAAKDSAEKAAEDIVEGNKRAGVNGSNTTKAAKETEDIATRTAANGRMTPQGANGDDSAAKAGIGI